MSELTTAFARETERLEAARARIAEAEASKLEAEREEADAAVGFEQCGLHVLRHSNVALRLATDPPQDLMYIAEQLGHSSASFTLRVYGHLIRRPGRAAGLDAAFRALGSYEGR